MRELFVVAGLIPHPRDASRFLVQQRPPGKSRPLLWEFPGGKVEPPESDAEALVREGLEELAVSLRVGALRYETRHAYHDVTVRLRVYDASILSGEPQALGALALRFVTPAEMLTLPFCEADLPFLRRLAGV